MSTGLSTMRAAVQTALAAFFTSADWESGEPPASRVPNDQSIGFVWAERVDMDSDNKLLETVTCGVRLYLTYNEQLDPAAPGDPTPLEQAAADLQTTLGPASFPGDPWYFDVKSIELNNREVWLEAAIEGHRWNDAAVS